MTHADPLVPPPPPPPPTPTRPLRLVRARTDRKLGGVAGGLAALAGIDASLVRAGLAAGILTGWAALAYVIAWLVLPEEDEAAGRPLVAAPEPVARRIRIGLAVVAGLGALQIAGIVAAAASAVFGAVAGLFDPFIDPFAGEFGGHNPDFPVRGFVGFVLVAGGGLFLIFRRRHLPAQAADTAEHAGSSPAGVVPPPGGPTPVVGAAPGHPWRTADEWVLLATRVLGWLVALWFAAAGAVLVGLWAFDALRLRLPFVLAVATIGALGLLGAVLVRSRRPALIWASAAALLLPVALTVVLARWNGVVGYRSAAPTSVAEVPAVYRHAAGQFRLDLTGLALPEGTTELAVKVEMGTGEVEITVPWNVAVEATARVGVGEFNLLGTSQAGLSLEGEALSPGESGAPTIKILGRASAGQVKVFRQSPPPPA